MEIFLDCETTYTDQQWFKEEIVISPPGNYKKQESIQKWMDENAETAKQEIIEKTALDTSLARIICLGYAVGNENIKALTGPEDEILAEFFAHISVFRSITLVGHNIIGFDIPLIYHRAIINDIRPHKKFHMHYKPWGGDAFDTAVEWAGQKNYIKLDRLCRLLGIEGKGDIDGSLVPALYEAGEIEKIAEYCKDDVSKVRQIYNRLTGN